MPMFGGCYTIDTIQPIPPEIYNPNESVGLRFIELVNPICPCNRGEPMFFWSEHFEPLVEDQQNISALVDAAAKVTLPKREDAKAVGSVSATIAHGGAVLRALRQQRAVLCGDRPGEALLTPRQLAALQGFAPHFADQGEAAIEACERLKASVDKAADEITREFVRTFIIPWLAKRLGLVLLAGVMLMAAAGAAPVEAPASQLIARDPTTSRPICALAAISGVDYAVTIDWDCVDRRVKSIAQDQQLNLQDAFTLSLDAVRRGNFLIKLVKEVPNPDECSPDISDERAGQGGAVFFGGLLIAGILAYLIAGRGKVPDNRPLERAKDAPVMRKGWKGRWLIFEGERYKELHDDGSVRLYVATYDEMVASDWRVAPQKPAEF